MLSKIMSLKLQKSMLYIVLQAPLLTIYIRHSSQLWKSAHYEISSRKLKLKGFKQRAKYCMLFSGKSWDFYKHINKQGRYLVYISQYRRYSTNKMFLHLLWMIHWHCVVYCLHWILEIVIFTVVMQLIRLFLVVNNNLIIDKLLQTTKKRLLLPRALLTHLGKLRLVRHCGANTCKWSERVFFFVFFRPLPRDVRAWLFDPSTHTTYRSPGSLTVGTGW